MVFLDGISYPVAFFQILSSTEVVLGLTGLPSGMMDIDVMVVAGMNCSLTVPDLYDAPLCPPPPAPLARNLSPKTEAQFLVSQQNSTGNFGNFTERELITQIDEWAAIGGGWSDAVPFSCEDACGPVTVEILVMDYWCNWSTAWTKVWVEDKTPVEVVKDVVEQEVITCKVYKESNYAYPGQEHPVSIEYLVAQAKLAQPDAYTALDNIFGGYCKVWKDPYGNYVDQKGDLIECDIPFYDSICDCSTQMKQVRIYDEHRGYIWVDSLVTDCYYEPDTLNFQKGLVVVNCSENVFCDQEVWCEFDHCGQGYIFRKFKIWQGCPERNSEGMPDSLQHPVDTIYRHQRIWVGNECTLNKYMFQVPGDIEVISCALDYDAAGNVIGDAGPENTGYATYRFDDDCRIVGIAHQDKVFKIVGGDAACYKILRTWYFADWCAYGGDTPSGNWWLDRDIVVDECVQKIIVRDTLPPVCLITGPVNDGDTVSLYSCDYSVEISIEAMDACGLNAYHWGLKEVSEAVAQGIDEGHGILNGDEKGSFPIALSSLAPGSYELVVYLQDECTNEGSCTYNFTVSSEKKPTPVCLTTLSTRLTPWDSDGDGEVDTANAVVWAYEFDRSSTAACGDDSLEYRIEFLDLRDDETIGVGDLDFLEVGCAHIGTRLVRVWMISNPSGTSDYCDAVLVIQSDFSGCINQGGGSGDQQMAEEDTSSMVNNQQRRPNGNPSVVVSGDALGGSILQAGYGLEQNLPNPFQYETSIGFTLPESMQITLEIYDLRGRRLKQIGGIYDGGFHQITIRNEDLGGNGIYYYRMQAGVYIDMKKMIMVE
jgi:hypothetical protein